MHSAVLQYAAALIFGYLCGSIPFGVLLTRLAGAPDLRNVGSGNIGATNVLRTGRKLLAAATLAGDILKGTAAVAVTGFVFDRDAALYAALGALLGHLFPVWLNFKGGKGVATYVGLMLGLALWLALTAFCLICIALFLARRLDRHRRHAGGAVVERQRGGGKIISAAVGARLADAPRQYCAADQRHGKPDRRRVTTPSDFFDRY
jgi:acyl-phosphate glycerol 3-phosphate acyltransferase